MTRIALAIELPASMDFLSAASKSLSYNSRPRSHLVERKPAQPNMNWVHSRAAMRFYEFPTDIGQSVRLPARKA